jgi:hypothetical protein
MITQASSRTSPDEATTAVVVDKGSSGVATKIGGYRWKICGLLFFATTLNYMDRQVLGLLKPQLRDPTRLVKPGRLGKWPVCVLSLAHAD